MEIVNFLQATPGAFIVVSLILGLLVGSFLNVVIYRLPVMLERTWLAHCHEMMGKEPAPSDPTQQTFNLVVPRSRCRKCGHAISAVENIPVFSYLLLRGKCSECGSPISPRYPIIEAVTAVLTAVVAAHFGFGWQAGAAMLLTWSLITLTMIDFDHQLLPDDITLPLLWIGLLVSLFGLFTDPQSSILGAIGGYLSLWTVYQAFKLVTGKEGMGYGDFKLLAMLGAWMGWQQLPVIILLSSLVGALVGIALILLRGRDRNIPIPFGPYLAAAGWLSLIWGSELSQLYLNMAGIQ